MPTSRNIITAKDAEGTPIYLVLLGPFEYQFWTGDPQRATQLTRSRAHAYQQIVGGEVLELE